MEKGKKHKLIFFISVILLFILPVILPLIFGQTVVQVNEPATPEKKNFLSNTFGFLKSPIFWYVMIGIIVVIGLLVGIFFLVRWIVKFFKARNDIFWMLKNERMKLAKIQKRYSSNHWYKTEKNTPIRFVQNNNGQIKITSPVAYHRGDYTTHEGNVVLCINLKDNKKYLFFPVTDLLIIPNKPKMEIIRKNEKGKPEKIVIDNLPQAKDIIQFNEDEILIHAESLSKVGSSQVGFYVPVLKAIDGKILDLSLPVYQSLKEVILGDFLYEQSSEFVALAKKSMNLNPNLAYSIKSADANQSVEVPQGS